jgi:serine/threonine protein kinase
MSSSRRRFRIIKEIAEGGFGKVYLAEQISADGFSRIVAVKLLHAKWSSHEEVVMRTRDEARLLGLIRHQHIVKVEDLTSIDGKCAIVMEYLEGVDLKGMSQFLKDRGQTFPGAALFEMMAAVASALDAAYNGRPLQGGDPLRVIHRDIKPSNVFASVAGSIKVLDFGTARANFEQREAKTQALAFGSQGYMAPERMLGEKDTPAADVFSLGITLYELLTQESFGRIPPRPAKFSQKVADRVGSLKLEGEDHWVQQVRDTLAGMLAYDPRARPSASHLVDVFEGMAQEGEGTGLRRFCRTLVAEAKSATPEVDTGDPLCGQVVNEDHSIGFARPKAVTNISPPSLEGGTPPELSTMDEFSSSLLNAPSLPATPQKREVPSQGTGGAGDAPLAQKKSSVGILIAGGVGAVFLGMVALVALAFVVTKVLSKEEGTSHAVTEQVVASEPSQVEEPVEVAPEERVEPEASGGEILSMGSQAGGQGVATLLTCSSEDGAAVELKNRGGFSAKWDGKGSFDIGKLMPGIYRTKVLTSEGASIRNKSFEVEAGADACRFMLDLQSKEWVGDCL